MWQLRLAEGIFLLGVFGQAQLYHELIKGSQRVLIIWFCRSLPHLKTPQQAFDSGDNPQPGALPSQLYRAWPSSCKSCAWLVATVHCAELCGLHGAVHGAASQKGAVGNRFLKCAAICCDGARHHGLVPFVRRGGILQQSRGLSGVPYTWYYVYVSPERGPPVV